MGIPSNRRSAVEPKKRGRIVYQAAKAGTDHDDAFVQERQYAVSDNTVYIYDMENDAWNILGMG